MIVPIPNNKVPRIGNALRGKLGKPNDTDEQLIRQFIYETLKGLVWAHEREQASNSVQEPDLS